MAVEFWKADRLLFLVRRWIKLAVLLSAMLVSVLMAPATAREDFATWREGLWPDADAMGITRSTFDTALKGVKPDRSLPDLILPGRKKKKRQDKCQAEFVKTPGQYLNARQLGFLAKRGKQLNLKYDKQLIEIEGDFGVPRSMLLAIFGRETAFGSYKLKRDAIRALTTQAYLGRRADFFRKELLLAIKILQEGHVSRKKMRSSWAGALGLTQFMPSDFYKHAVDGDGDGRADIWNSVPDALASAAKQFLDNGWERDKSWGEEVHLPKGFDCTLEGPHQMRSIREWRDLGLSLSFNKKFDPSQDDEKAYVLLPEGTYGPVFLLSNNFLVIKKYNFADLYALFVGNLADRIDGAGKLEKSWVKSKFVRTWQIVEMQEHLAASGLYTDKIDGKVGAYTRNAIGMYQKANGLKPDCWPTNGLLKDMRRRASR